MRTRLLVASVGQHQLVARPPPARRGAGQLVDGSDHAPVGCTRESAPPGSTQQLWPRCCAGGGAGRHLGQEGGVVTPMPGRRAARRRTGSTARMQGQRPWRSAALGLHPVAVDASPAQDHRRQRGGGNGAVKARRGGRAAPHRLRPGVPSMTTPSPWRRQRHRLRPKVGPTWAVARRRRSQGRHDVAGRQQRPHVVRSPRRPGAAGAALQVLLEASDHIGLRPRMRRRVPDHAAEPGPGRAG